MSTSEALSRARAFDGLVVLSPHADDAVLSCGGLLHDFAASGPRPLVLTVASGVPAAAREGFRAQLASAALRRREDAAALAAVGCDLVELGFLDAIDREDPQTGRLLYSHWSELFGEIAAGDREHTRSLLRAILGALEDRWGAKLLLVPLAIGRHVDHQLVAGLAVELQSAAAELWFYEDAPYCLPGYTGSVPTESSRAALGRLPRAVWREAPQCLEHPIDLPAKLGHLAAYESQIHSLFGDLEGLRVAFASCVDAAGRPVERFWSTGQTRLGSRPAGG